MKPFDQRGHVLTQCLRQSIPEGLMIRTADNGRLVGQAPRPENPPDHAPATLVDCLAAIRPVTPADDPYEKDVFVLTTALADSEGRLWERSRNLYVDELWETALQEAVLYQDFSDPRQNPVYRRAEIVTRRDLVPPVNTLCDGRERHLIEVLRFPSTASQPASGEINPYENTERWLYRLHFKYFSAEMGLVEECSGYRNTATGILATNSHLLLTIQPNTDTDLIACLNRQDALLPVQEAGLAELGPLCSRGIRFEPGWERPNWKPARLADSADWQEKLRQTGAPAPVFNAFKANPMIRYEAGQARTA